VTTLRTAINPLPWFLGPRAEWLLDPETLDDALGVVTEAGFGAVSIEIPAEFDVEQYCSTLAAGGVAPAPGYFGADFHDLAARSALIEAASRHARIHRELGVSQTFIASNLSPERIASPAVGAAPDPARTATIAETVALVVHAMGEEGVTASLHQHVSSWIETEQELDEVLAAVPELGFGPDTGHLFWAGMDPVAVMTRHRDRITGVHIKDASSSAMARAKAESLDYFGATHIDLWRELGEGDVALAEALAVVPEEFGGWFVVEVDVPSLPTAEESTLASGAWVRRWHDRVKAERS
jgi:inosose dehydratase